ncbi:MULTISPECIES: hypothetical protein [unclassified Clostridium]|nr:MULTISPECIES: hypothetical protein [unclassified Clostridium]MBZ9692060.1 hypothetical protein [Clostridium sp. M14]
MLRISKKSKIIDNIVVDYLEFTKTKEKYSYVSDINSLKSNNPSAR